MPTIMYGCGKWKLNKSIENKLRVTQKQMKREHIRNKKRPTWIKEQTKVRDTIEVIKQKYKWLGNITKRKTNRYY